MDAYTQLKIMVIDDDAFALKLIVQQLENLGCHGVVTSMQAPIGLMHLAGANGHTDVIFCDLDMPEMDGVEFVRNLVRTSFNGGVVLVSGEDKRILSAAERLARDHRLRVLGALSKPVSPTDLRRVLDCQLDDPTVLGRVRKAYTAEELGRAIENDELFCE